jgi:DNA-binding MarR family transcriptional regulator
MALITDEERIINIIESISSKLIQLKSEGLKSIKGLDLSANHFQYISILDKTGEVTFTELAEKLQISKPAVTAFISKLLKEKIVIKTQSGRDRRIFYIKLSPKGRKIAEIYNKAMMTFAAGLKKNMTGDEFNQLTSLLEKGSEN